MTSSGFPWLLCRRGHRPLLTALRGAQGQSRAVSRPRARGLQGVSPQAPTLERATPAPVSALCSAGETGQRPARRPHAVLTSSLQAPKHRAQDAHFTDEDTEAAGLALRVLPQVWESRSSGWGSASSWTRTWVSESTRKGLAGPGQPWGPGGSLGSTWASGPALSQPSLVARSREAPLTS